MGKGLCCPTLSCQQRAGEAGPAGPPFLGQEGKVKGRSPVTR